MIFENREAWASFTSRKLKEQKLEARVDHRTLEGEGIDRKQTVHLGPSVSSIEWRGVRTDVGYRLQEEASARIERAAEIAAIRSESGEFARSILSLDTRISAALAARDVQKAARQGREQDAAIGAQRGKALTPDEIQRAARAKWRRYREPQLEKGQGKGRDIEADQSKELERTEDRSKKHTPDDEFSLGNEG